MTYIELVRAIRDLGFDCAFEEFVDPPSVPYCVVSYTHNRDVMAGNKNYLPVGNYQVELYTDGRNPPSEGLIQDKLIELKLPYFKMGGLSVEKGLYRVIYEIQLIGG